MVRGGGGGAKKRMPVIQGIRFFVLSVVVNLGERDFCFVAPVALLSLLAIPRFNLGERDFCFVACS